jgi:hypothetical protein
MKTRNNTTNDPTSLPLQFGPRDRGTGKKQSGQGSQARAMPLGTWNFDRQCRHSQVIVWAAEDSEAELLDGANRNGFGSSDFRCGNRSVRWQCGQVNNWPERSDGA